MKLDLLTFELDIAKARKGAMVGEERVWHGTTYVKTISGWKPKSKERNPKQEEAPSPRMKKIEDPAKSRVKQLEEFASKAKDSQLEAAIEDPKQEQEVKDIAQAELDKRTGGAVEEEKKGKKKKEKFTPDPTSLAILEKFDSLKKELKEMLDKKQEEKGKQEKEFKVIKKTGVTVDGKKIFITMNENNSGYVAKGSGVNITSEEGEDLASFKAKVKEEAQKVLGKKKEETQKLKEQLENDLGRKLGEDFKPIKKTGVTVDGHKTFITMDNGDYVAKVEGEEIRSKENESLKDFKEEVREKINNRNEEWSADRVIERVESTLEKGDTRIKTSYYEYVSDYEEKINKLYDSGDKYELNSFIGGVFAGENLISKLALNSVLVGEGILPYCSPNLYEEWEGEQYKVFNDEEKAVDYYVEESAKIPKKSEKLDSVLSWYRSDGYAVFTAAALGKYRNAKDSVMSSLDFEEKEPVYEKDIIDIMKDTLSGDFKEKISQYQKLIDDFLDSYEIPENIVLSRRMGGSQVENLVNSLNIGDVFTMKPMQSFALETQSGFGHTQITLLAKKGQKGITPIDNEYELEYLTRSNMKTRVVSKGYNSMTIELI